MPMTAWEAGEVAGSPPSKAAPSSGTRAAPIDVPVPVGLVIGVRLAPGVTVMLDDADRTPTSDEVAALRHATQPLLAELAVLGLTGGSHRAGHPHHRDPAQDALDARHAGNAHAPDPTDPSTLEG
jgi:hypothetical protein